MLIFLFLVGVLRFSNNVFFLGFSLLFLRCFLVFYVWNFVSQWLGLIFFLVYITGVIVIFIFFCSFSRNVGGLVFNPFYSLFFFLLLTTKKFSFFYRCEKKELYESKAFYFSSELMQLILLGIWLIFVLWSSLKIIKVLGGVVRYNIFFNILIIIYMNI